MELPKRMTWLTHNGQQILVTDWTYIDNDKEFVEIVVNTSNYVIQLGQYDLLELINLQGSNQTATIIRTMQDMASETRPFNKRKAVIGVTGVKRVLLNTINRFAGESIKAFKTEHEALSWLIE